MRKQRLYLFLAAVVAALLFLCLPGHNPDVIDHARTSLVQKLANITGNPSVKTPSFSLQDSELLIRNTKIPGPAGKIPVRIYSPNKVHNAPVIVFYHGGGWVAGDLDRVDDICRKMARKSSAILVSVDYRLAPENPFPAGLNDCYAALEWTYENARSINGDPNRIVIAGNSAGGNLAAAVVLKAHQENGPPIIAQVLNYPVTNCWSLDTASYKEYGNGAFLNLKQMNYYLKSYVPNREDRKNPLVSPLLANNLEGLPPALITTAEKDALRDEGEAYARRMQDAGVSVTLKRYKGMPHGFIGMKRYRAQTDRAINDMALYLKKQDK